MNRLNTRAWLAAGAIAATIAAAFAHGGATGIVGERMMGMMMLSEQIKLLTPPLSTGQQVAPAKLREAAGMIRMHAGPAMTELFPPGSIEPPSEARPEIWARWDEFTGHAERLAELALELELSAAEAQPARAVITQATRAPAPSEWERMDFDTLMGLPKASPHAGHQMGVDPTVVGSIAEAAASPVRPPQQIFAEITATCSSCHASFRR